MLKKILSFLLATLLLSLQVSAQPSKTLTPLTLATAIESAIANHPQLTAILMKQTAAESGLNLAKKQQSDVKKSPFIVNDLIYIKNGYSVAASEMQLRLAKSEYEQLKQKIAYQVTEKYFNLKLAEQMLSIYQNAINMAEENCNLVTTQLAIGMVSELEAENAQIQLKRNQHSYNTALRNIEIAKEDLKIAMHHNGEFLFTLTDSLSEIAPYESNVEEDITAALQTRYDLTALREKANLDKLYFTITDKMTAPNTEAYQSAYSAYLQSDYTYQNTQDLIGLSLRASYNNISATKGNLDIAELTLNVKQREYDTAKMKFEMGMITNLELTQIQTALLQSQTELEQAKLTHLLAIQKYQYEITYGL